MDQVNSREIENKFRIEANYKDPSGVIDMVSTVLRDLKHDYRLMNMCETEDTYWSPPNGSKMQIVRIRDSIGRLEDGEFHILKEITIKAKDRSSNKNRLERNLGIGNAGTAKQVLSDLLGSDPIGTIRKSEAIWFIGHKPDETIVSVSKIHNDNTMYLEVEGPTSQAVDQLSQHLKAALPMKREMRSLFEIYIRPSE